MSGSRIAVLELRSVRGTGGGPEKTILLGAERSDRDRFAVTVCYVRDLRDDVFKIDERARAMGVDYVEVTEQHSFDPGIWSKLTALVRDRRIDVVHSHDYKTDMLALLLAHRHGVIPLSTAHGWTGQSGRERYLYYPIEKRLLARFPRVIAVSTDIRDELVRHGTSSDRVRVVLNAIDAAAFRRVDDRRDAVRKALGYDSTHVVVGAVGRLERQKRFDLLLEAFAALASQSSHLRLVIVGDGSLRNELDAGASALGIADRCQFLGHRDDIALLHHAFDLYVQSSEYEGTPNAVLEAMAMESPLVATDVGGTRELAAHGEHGLIVPKNDVPALRSAMQAALADRPAARTRSAAARRRVESDLSFEARTRRLEGIYEELVRERASAGAAGQLSRAPHA
jgi:glycosyltransferase involved in cell wall biosynthesis